jgi:hypothetical protein
MCLSKLAVSSAGCLQDMCQLSADSCSTRWAMLLLLLLLLLQDFQYMEWEACKCSFGGSSSSSSSSTTPAQVRVAHH